MAALSVKSSQYSCKVGLCYDMSVVTRHCQCIRYLFLHVPQRFAYGLWRFRSTFLSTETKVGYEANALLAAVRPP